MGEIENIIWGEEMRKAPRAYVNLIIYKYVPKKDGEIKQLQCDYIDKRNARIREESLAVEYAISQIKKRKDADIALKYIDMVYIKKTHAPYGARMELFMSGRQANSIVIQFRRAVADWLGLD